MIYFTADTHFGHASAIRFCERPFADVAAMNAALLDAINGRVGAGDELYVLGDFSFKMSAADAAEVRRGIRCGSVHLVPGNHDRDWTRPDVAGTFAVEPPIREIKAGGRRIVLCHYPIADWAGMRHGSIHLHGHIHATRAYNERMRGEGTLRYDVGVDANGYAPVSLDEVLGFFEGAAGASREAIAATGAISPKGAGAPRCARPRPGRETPPCAPPPPQRTR